MVNFNKLKTILRKKTVAGHEDGLSFVEVLASLAIVSLIAGLATSSLFTFVRFREVAREEETLKRVHHALDHMVQTLKGYQPIKVSALDGSKLHGIRGSSNNLWVVGISDGTLFTAGYYLVNWKASETNNHYEVSENWQPIPNAVGVEVPVYSEPLMQEIKSIEFQYLPFVTNAGPDSWVDSWQQQQEGFPAAIKITVEAEIGSIVQNISRIAVLAD